MKTLRIAAIAAAMAYACGGQDRRDVPGDIIVDPAPSPEELAALNAEPIHYDPDDPSVVADSADSESPDAGASDAGK